MELRILSDEGMWQIIRENWGLAGVYGDDMERVYKAIIRETLRQVIKWGEEPCPHTHVSHLTMISSKRQCPHCWQQLKEMADGH